MSESRRAAARHGEVAPPVSAFLADPSGVAAEVVDDPHNLRIKVVGATPASFDAAETLLRRIQEAAETPRTKLTVYAFPGADEAWEGRGFRSEATIRGYFPDGRDAHLVARYTDPDRASDPYAADQDEIVALARGKAPVAGALPAGLCLRAATEPDAPMLAAFLRSVFPDYPTSLADDHVGTLVRTGASRFQLVVDEKEQLLACASAELDRTRRSAEITDCATQPEARGRGLMVVLLRSFEKDLPAEEGIRDLYTIARAGEVGMNCAFARAGYDWTGRLVNNCRMPGGFESMNVWCRRAAEGGAPESR